MTSQSTNPNQETSATIDPLLLATCQQELMVLRQANQQLRAELAECQREKIAMQRSETIYRTLLENSSDCVCHLDLEGNFLYMNQGGIRINELEDATQLYGQPCTHNIQLEYHASMQAALARARQGKSTKLEYVSINKQGRQLWWEGIVSAIKDHQGNIIGLLRVSRNINQKRKSEDNLHQLNAELEARIEERTQALREKNSELQAILDNSPAVIYIKDTQGRFIRVNHHFETLFHLTEAEVKGKSNHDIFPKKVADVFWRNDQKILRTARAIQFEERIQHHDEVHTHLSLKFPLLNEKGEPYAICGISTDITELKQMQEALQRSQQLLQLVLDTIPQRIFYKDLNHRYLGCNRAFAEDAGLQSPDQIVGKQDQDLPWQTYAHLFNAEDQRIIERNTPKLNVEEPKLRADGTTQWLRTTIIPLHDEAGKVFGVFGCYEDISDRKQTEQALMLYKKAVEGSSDAISFADPAGNHFYQNQAFSQLYECATPQVFNEFGGLSATFTDAAVAQEILDMTLAGKAWVGEAEQRSRHNYIMQTLIRAYAIRNEQDDVVGLVSAITDITERKQAEKALQQSEAQLQQRAKQLKQTLRELRATQTQLIQTEKMSSLGQLVAGVAHEINNPVNFIHGNLEHVGQYAGDLLALIDLYEQQISNVPPAIRQQIDDIDLEFIREDLPKILSSMNLGTDRIRGIVQSLRTFSRLDESAMKEVDIHEGINSTLVILSNRLKAKPDHSEIQVIKEYGTLPMVECYSGQLNQVFMNILSNALDALEEERASGKENPTPSIWIRTEVVDPQWVRITIADNGPGMATSVHKKLFDPFFTTKPVGKGTGMGMSISYQIITEKHGGKLICQSAPGEGAEFIIEIPIRQ
ncbi:MAG: PAS domain S-box protein [Scytolyngbya sp. HA4215-MV1]|nr:PAS domain S-box protein [Scytolyngbya sp. HA4215-MV1]